MKTLYLDGRQGVEVFLDGPALRVRSSGRADGRYPLSRISRVVTLGEVNWRPHALLACLHARVPIAVLDNRGRFIRLRFPVAVGERGLARHIGELIGIDRYRYRYLRWLRMAEMREIETVVHRYGINARGRDPGRLWQRVIAARTSALPRCRPGKYYAYLRGLAMAHFVSSFSRVGLPANMEMWSKYEYGFLNDLIRMEQWNHVDIVDRILAVENMRTIRRSLTEAFEAQTVEREKRLAAWRQGLLFDLMGIRINSISPEDIGLSRFDEPLTLVSEPFVRICNNALEAVGSNTGLLPIAPGGSLRTSIKILKSWLRYGQEI